MAKMYGITGNLSGKMGNVVFSVRSGTQIARQYQPIVSNPKSTGQRLQRAKANLVGQISKIVPYQILEGLGTSKTKRRARFLRLSLNGATAVVSSSDPSTINAKLDARNFKFSEGVIVPTISMTSLLVDRNTITVNLQRIGGVEETIFQSSGCLAVVVMLTADGTYESVFYRFVSASEFSENAFSFQIAHINEGAYTAVGYIAPFETQDGSSLRARADELFGEGRDFAAAMSYNPSAMPLVYGSSEYVRAAEYTPSQTSLTRNKK